MRLVTGGAGTMNGAPPSVYVSGALRERLFASLRAMGSLLEEPGVLIVGSDAESARHLRVLGEVPFR